MLSHRSLEGKERDGKRTEVTANGAKKSKQVWLQGPVRENKKGFYINVKVYL